MGMISRMQSWSNRKILAFMMGLSVFLVLVGLIITNLGSGGDNHERKVAATIFPVYDLVKKIVGEELEVVLVMPAGASPHTFELSANEAARVAGADLIFGVGNGLDDWVLEKAADLQVKRKIILDEKIDKMSFEEGNGEGNSDPHYWLSIPNAMRMALSIKEALSNEYPDLAGMFNENYEQVILDLVKLDREYRNSLGSLENKKMATYHSAWRYLAREYGLEIVAEFEGHPGEQPSPDDVAEFIKKIVDLDAGAIYVEPQFSDAAIKQLARDSNLKIEVLDPIGGVENRMSYIELMRFNLKGIINGQKR